MRNHTDRRTSTLAAPVQAVPVLSKNRRTPVRFLFTRHHSFAHSTAVFNGPTMLALVPNRARND